MASLVGGTGSMRRDRSTAAAASRVLAREGEHEAQSGVGLRIARRQGHGLPGRGDRVLVSTTDDLQHGQDRVGQWRRRIQLKGTARGLSACLRATGPGRMSSQFWRQM